MQRAIIIVLKVPPNSKLLCLSHRSQELMRQLIVSILFAESIIVSIHLVKNLHVLEDDRNELCNTTGDASTALPHSIAARKGTGIRF